MAKNDYSNDYSNRYSNQMDGCSNMNQENPSLGFSTITFGSNKIPLLL